MLSFEELLALANVPQVNVASGIALANSLASEAPKDPAPGVLKSLGNLQTCAGLLQQQWGARARAAGEADGSAAVRWDRSLDAAWRALHGRVDDYAKLPVGRFPKAERAVQIRGRLFSSGLTFLRLPFTEQWAHSDTVLKRIDGEGMAADLDEIAGPDFLAEVRHAHQQYGAALGKTAPLPSEGERVNFIEALRSLADAIRGYVVQVIATADPDQPETVEAARAALKPIEDLRAEVARRRNDSGKTEEPAPAPTPIVKPVTG